jgi:hypothetical protein
MMRTGWTLVMVMTEVSGATLSSSRITNMVFSKPEPLGRSLGVEERSRNQAPCRDVHGDIIGLIPVFFPIKKGLWP